jgi:hypothetical protein
VTQVGQIEVARRVDSQAVCRADFGACRQATVTCVTVSAITRHRGDISSGRVDLANARIANVTDIDVTRRVDGEATWRIDLGVYRRTAIA